MSPLQTIVLLGLIILVLLAFVRLFMRGGGQAEETDSPIRPVPPIPEIDSGEADDGEVRQPVETDVDDRLPQAPGGEGFSEESVHEEETIMARLRTQSKLYHYTAHVTSVYDGDTATVNIDLGLGLWRHGQTIRFWKVNTPELRGPEREDGLRVRDFVRELILDRDILLRTILDKRGKDRTGKFGRLLGEILVEDDDGMLINVNDLLLEKNMAVAMGEDGSTPKARVPAPSASPMPGAESPACIECRYCGEERDVLGEDRCIETCPNCLDKRYRF